MSDAPTARSEGVTGGSPVPTCPQVFEKASKGHEVAAPNMVFLAHGTELLSVFHLPFMFANFASKPFDTYTLGTPQSYYPPHPFSGPMMGVYATHMALLNLFLSLSGFAHTMCPHLVSISANSVFQQCGSDSLKQGGSESQAHALGTILTPVP